MTKFSVRELLKALEDPGPAPPPARLGPLSPGPHAAVCHPSGLLTRFPFCLTPGSDTPSPNPQSTMEGRGLGLQENYSAEAAFSPKNLDSPILPLPRLRLLPVA